MNNRKIILSLFMTLLFCHVLTAQSTNFRALVVGVRDYPGTEQDLPINIENDATDMQNYLVWYQGWSSNNIEVKLNSYATANEITSYISSMPNTRGTSEVFFYSGHGTENGLYTYSGTVTPGNLQDAFGESYNQYCCILHSCHSGEFVYGMSKGEILTSCSAGEVSWAEGYGGNSPYGYYILEGLKNNQADPTVGHVVSAKELHYWAAPRAKDYVYNHYYVHMHPLYEGNLGIFNFHDLKTTSGTLIDNELWDQNITLTGNVTVPTGVTLKILSGITIYFNGHAILSDGGIITCENNINGLRAKLEANTFVKGLYGSIQSAANAAAQDNEIILEDGNFNENVSISNKSDLRILGGSTSYKHFGQLTLTNCDYFEGLYFGAKSVIINYSDYAILNWIYALGTNQTTYGFYIYNSDVNANDILAYYSQAGVSCYDGTEADIDESWLYSNLRGLEAYNGSNVDISNTYFCGTGLDLKTYNFSSIEAGFCYFNGGTPSVSGSNIQHYGDQSCPVSKTNPDQQTGDNNYVNSTNEDNTAGSEFEKINSAYFDINRRLINALKEKTSFNSEAFCSEYETVIADFKEFIKSNPDSPQAKIALIASARSYRRIDGLRGKSEFADMKNFLTSIIENREFPGLIPQAERLMIDYYKFTDNFTEAIKTADNIIEEYQKDTNYVCSAIYAKGLILAYNLNQPE